MITQVQLPTQAQIKSLVDEATSKVGREVFFENNLRGIKTMLDSNPSLYHHYGPYWWAVKDLLVANGVLDGQEDEPITRKHFKFDDPIYTLCAAWAYHQHQIESMVINTNLHYFDLDGEPYEYALEDLEMETWAKSRKR